MSTERIPGIYWLPDDKYAMAITQLRMQIGGTLEVFRVYGQDIFVDQAIIELVRLSEDFGLRVRGVDKPISLDLVRNGGDKK